MDLSPGPNAYQASSSPILRFGIAASVWLAVGLVQVIFLSEFVQTKNMRAEIHPIQPFHITQALAYMVVKAEEIHGE